MHQQVDHKEWLKKCYLYRQQIGARLEVLASLADKQIAQEDAKGPTTKKTPASSPTSTVHSGGMSNLTSGAKNPASAKAAPVASRASVNAPPAAPSPFPAAQVPATNSIQPQSMGSLQLSIFDADAGCLTLYLLFQLQARSARQGWRHPAQAPCQALL